MEQFTDALIIEQLVKTSNPGVVSLRFVSYEGVDKKSINVAFNRETKKWDLFTNTTKQEFLDLDIVIQYLYQNGYVDEEWKVGVYAKIDKIYFANVPNSELEVTQKAKSSFWDRVTNKMSKPKIVPVFHDLSENSNDNKVGADVPAMENSGQR
jgi:hypothetical protein